MSNFIIGILTPLGASALFAVLTMLLKREKTHDCGLAIGKFMSPFFGGKLGAKYDKFEGTLQTTIYDFAMGLIEGLDVDDEVKWKGPEE